MVAPIESDIEVFQYDCNRSDRDDEQDILILSYELHVTLQKMFQRIRNMSHCIRNMFELTGRSCFNVAALTSGKLLQDEVTMYQEGRAIYLQVGRYQECMASYLTKMLQNTRNIIQGTWRRCDNVMHGTCRKCRAEDVTMHQEGVASHLKKMLLRIRNIWQVTVRRGDNVSGRACNLLTSRKMLLRIRNVWQATWRRCCKIPGTSFKGLEEDVTTSCMEHVASVAQKMSQCIRKGLQVIWRRCYYVSGTSGKLL